MMNDKFDFPYFYDHDHKQWLRDATEPERLTLCKIAETALSFFARAVVLVAVIMLLLCG